MTQPLLILLAGPNGAGKSTLVDRVLARQRPGLPFVNADAIAAARWPGAEQAHAYEASRLAAEERARLMAARLSFITETVFSHPSKADLVRDAVDQGYLVDLRVVLVPVETTVRRVTYRVEDGGHSVPEDKIRARYERLWPLVAQAARDADRAVFYDNSSARSPYRVVAEMVNGRLDRSPVWPAWTPPALRDIAT